MEALYTYKSNIPGYIMRRVMITVIAFLIISFLIFMSFYNIGGYYDIPGVEYEHRFDSGILNYFRWIGAIFTGDLGESLVLN